MAGRRITRKATAGKIMPPVDVTSMKSLKGMWDRIAKGPLTMVLVYAPWCGHCHRLMPHFDAAAKTAGRTVQIVKVNDKMLPAANTYMRQNSTQAKPIEVNGYPTVLLVKKNGAQVIPVNAVNDTARLSKLMRESGSVAAEEMRTAPAPRPALPPVAPEENAFDLERSEPMERSEPVEVSESPEPAETNIVAEESENMAVAPATFIPPTSEDEGASAAKASKPIAIGGGRRRIGGSLLASMSAAAYQLAPAAVLLGLQKALKKGGARRTVKRAKARRTAKRTAKRNNRK